MPTGDHISKPIPQPPRSSSVSQIALAMVLWVGMSGAANWGYNFVQGPAKRVATTAPLRPQRNVTAEEEPEPAAANANTREKERVVDPYAEPPPRVTIGIAYGTEKDRWLVWAVDEFKKTPAGKEIEVKLIPMGSLEGAHAVLSGDQRIQVWSPASSLYKDIFVTEWSIKHDGQPIAREETLALTPMVFVMWKDRYEDFIKKYQQLNFKTIGQAFKEPGGWGGIADKGERGLFKFGHTHPGQSNSGICTLLLLAYDYQEDADELKVKEIVDPAFQSWLAEIERGVSGLSNSTGNMMREMILKGPSAYDCVMVYENVAIDYLKAASIKYGEIAVVYPRINVWNDNPYYILDNAWTSKEQQAAAGNLLDYLLSVPVQQRALVEHGLRPSNLEVSLVADDSPFVRYERYGLQREHVGTICKPVSGDVINNLEQQWRRLFPGR